MKSVAQRLQTKYSWYSDLSDKQKQNLEWFYSLDDDLVEALMESTRFFDYIQEDPLELVSDYLVDSEQMTYDEYLEMADDDFCREITNQVTDEADALLAAATDWWAAHNILDYLTENELEDVGIYDQEIAEELLQALPVQKAA